MATTYTAEFKEMAIKKALSKSPDTSLSSISKALGIASSTLCTWLNRSRQASSEDRQTPIAPSQWSIEKKFDALLATSNMAQEAIMQYCRQHGIFPHHLDNWKKMFVDKQSEEPSNKETVENKTLKAENKELKKELRRKEKALAEAAALLVLQKKAESYFSSKEDV